MVPVEERLLAALNAALETDRVGLTAAFRATFPIDIAVGDTDLVIFESNNTGAITMQTMCQTFLHLMELNDTQIIPLYNDNGLITSFTLYKTDGATWL